jgi:hypothetical protein
MDSSRQLYRFAAEDPECAANWTTVGEKRLHYLNSSLISTSAENYSSLLLAL